MCDRIIEVLDHYLENVLVKGRNRPEKDIVDVHLEKRAPGEGGQIIELQTSFMDSPYLNELH